MMNSIFKNKSSSKNQLKAAQLNSAIKIQSFWRGYIQRMKVKKLKERKTARKHIARQMLTSQQLYCQDLSFIIEKVQEPSVGMFEDPENHQILFSNVKQIYQMHKQFKMALEEVMENYHHHLTTLSFPFLSHLLKKEQFKSIYTYYCINYDKSNQMAKETILRNTEFSNFLKGIGLLNTPNALQSYLIKPLQRLCKYKLLLNNFLKRTEEYHRDYDNLLQALEIVEKLVRETNEDVGEYLLQEDYRQYRQTYPQLFQSMENPNRKLLLTLPEIYYIDLVKDQKEMYKEIAIFNDSILMIGSQKATLLKLDMMRDLPNLKYFKNLIEIVSETKYIIFQIKTEQQKELILEQRKKLSCKKDSSYLEVKMLGTEMRQSLFKSYTVYIAQVHFENVVKTIYPRFKDLFKVREIAQEKGLQLDLPVLQKEVFGTLKSKTIEKRLLAIQQFLEKILNCSDCYEIKEIGDILDLKEEDMYKKKQAQIVINLPNEQTVHLLIDRKERIKTLKKAVAENIGLVYSSQFQIFQIRNKTTQRLMHDDESINQIYHAQKMSFNPFKDSIEYVFSRHYYLDPEEEYAMFKNDFVRTQLQLSVIKANVREYRLEEELMITFMCLFAMYANIPIYDNDKIKGFIKDIGKKRYKITLDEFRTYYTQVEKMVMAEEDQLVTIPFLIIKILKNSPLYMCQQFQITVHYKCFKGIKSYIEALQEKMILGVKKGFILLLTVQTRHIVQRIPMVNVEIMEKHPTAIVLQIVNVGPLLRLDTQQAFEICKLIQHYQSLK